MGNPRRVPERSSRAPGSARSALLVAALALAGFAPPSACADDKLAADLPEMTLEQLSNIEVTSVSRHGERLSDAPASIYVITSEDIRRSGATNLPEALRLAPVLQVARADANQYAISARGFNSVLANKMLVMIDGRTVYSPLFSGVFWEAQDVVLGDIDRIEVISGPGGATWGTNAVNGIIHVITKSAHDTQGSIGGVAIGNEVRLASVRYGAATGPNGHYRVYARVRSQDNTEFGNGTAIHDAGDRAQGGFRADWAGSSAVTLQGDGYVSDIDQTPGKRRISGLNLIGRWTRGSEDSPSRRLQLFYDMVHRRQPGAIREELHTFDAEFQQGLEVLHRHRLLWGGGIRYQADHVVNLNPAVLAFIPADRRLTNANLFAQDDVELARDFNLILGAKLERNDYTDVELLPSARVAWKPSNERLVWAAVSRAVRAPSRIDRDFFVPGGAPHFLLDGGPDFESEIANVAEIGYRAQPTVTMSYSITLFRQDYDRLRTTEPTPDGPQFQNRAEGEIQGAEAWTSFRVAPFWRLSAGGVTLSKEVRLDPTSLDPTGGTTLGNDPKYWWKARSSMDLGRRVELDFTLRRIASLPSGPVPAYTAVDVRLGAQVRPDFTVAVVARNLLDNRHPEWGGPASRAELDRTLDVRLGWRMR
jgi:iron complex outermembrane recepter protein